MNLLKQSESRAAHIMIIWRTYMLQPILNALINLSGDGALIFSKVQRPRIRMNDNLVSQFPFHYRSPTSCTSMREPPRISREREMVTAYD